MINANNEKSFSTQHKELTTLDPINTNGYSTILNNPSLRFPSTPPIPDSSTSIATSPNLGADGHALHMLSEQGVTVLGNGLWYRKTELDLHKKFMEEQEKLIFSSPAFQEVLKVLAENKVQEDLIDVQIKILKELNPEKLSTIAHQIEELTNTEDGTN